MSEVAEQTQQETTANPEAIEGRTLEQQQADLRKIAEMRFKAQCQLVEIHLQEITKIMLASNGVNELQKRQANSALIEAIKFCFDFGLEVTNAKIRQGGVLAKQVNTLAAVMTQAMDSRMLLLADNYRMDEEARALEVATSSEETKTEETKGE